MLTRAQRTTSARPDPWVAALARVQEEKAKRQAEAALATALVHGDEIKDRCKRFGAFVNWAWPILEPETPYVHGWFYDAIDEHLEAITHGQLGNLAINIPPAFMKSLRVSVLWPAWEWGPGGRPGRRYLSSSYEENLALRDNEKMRTLVQSPEYQSLWGDRVRLTSSGVKRFSNSARGGREARAFLSMTGGRGDVVLIDDPHSVVKAEGDDARQKAVKVFRESVQNRINDPETSAIVVVMQRLHAKDVCGAIDEYGLNYERLILPMEYVPPKEGEAKRRTKLGFEDPRTKRGELLFPERFNAAAVGELKKIGAYAYSGQYQQAPVPREGGLFKREWFAGKTIRVVPQGVKWVRHWDLAATELDVSATTGARTAGVKMGRAPDGSYIVGHMIAAALDGAKVPALIKATAEIDTRAVEISLPQDPGQAGKVQKRSLISMLSGYVARATPETGDKVTRAEPFSVQCEGGNVYLLEGAWNEEFLDELCLFPGGNRKDIADACSGAFARLIPPPSKGKSQFAAPQVVSSSD